MHKAIRSRVSILERWKEIEELKDRNPDDYIPTDNSNIFYSSFMNQFNHFKNLSFLTVFQRSCLLHISTKTYYRIENNPNFISKDGRPPIVTAEEERYILNKIEDHQLRGDCLTPRQVREELEKYIQKKYKKPFLSINRQWWYRFRLKYDKIVSVIKVHSLETNRCEVTEEEVLNYYNELEKEISITKIPSLIINLDESGFIIRPDKDTKRNCVVINGCNAKPSFRDEIDGNHVSIVAGVTMDGQALKPLLISTTIKPPKEIMSTILGNSFEWYKTSKGYLNSKAMLFWIKNIYVPYLEIQKNEYGQNIRPLLIMDGLKSHQTDEVFKLLNENNVKTLFLPPHASHLLQCLDLSVFGAMKIHYKNYQSELFSKDQKRPKKIEKVLRSFHDSIFPPIIINGWIEGGIDFTIANGKIENISVNRTRVLSKLYPSQ